MELLLTFTGSGAWCPRRSIARDHHRMLTACLILLATLILVIWQSRGLGIVWSAVVWHFVWNATATFVAVIIVCLPLVVSNLVTIVSAEFFKIGFAGYASVMVPVNVLAVLATLAALLPFFRQDIPRGYEAAQLKRPAAAARARQQEYPHFLGLLFPRRHRADRARAAGDACGIGATPVLSCVYGGG